MKLKDLTFKGGVNVPHYKELSENAPLERAIDSDGNDSTTSTYGSTLWAFSKTRGWS